MGGSSRKASKKKTDKTSSQRKKSGRKEYKKRSRDYDSGSSDSDDVLSDLEPTSSLPSESRYRRKKNKSKKLRRRDHSVSSDSDTRSVSSESDSLSSYKNKKKRRSRIASKSRNRKSRNRSSSPERKRKRSGRDRNRKRLKKSKKHMSSSDSPSCSTCQSRGSSIEEYGRERRKKMKSNMDREKRPRGRELYKSHKIRKHRSPSCSSCSRESYEVHEKRKVRSPSCSSCSRGSERSISDGHGDGALVPVDNGALAPADNDVLVPVNNSRRLKSVIANAYEPYNEEESRHENDTNKEEIVYDRYDYPSPRSLASNEKGSKRELGNHSHDASNKRICLENEEVTELINGNDQKSALDDSLDGAGMNNSEEEKRTDIVSNPVSAPDGNDLESILRLKALENLRKFKGHRQTGPKSTNSNLKMSKEGDVDTIQNESTMQDSSKDQERNQETGPMLLNNDSSPPTEEVNNPDGEKSEQVSEIPKQEAEEPLKCLEEEKSSGPNSVSCNPPSIGDSHPDQGATTATTEPIPDDKPVSGKHGSEDNQSEAKDGSQFEQKTMSVMRGGETVQVSYKVYIPKRAPALTRRSLRR